MVYATSIYTDPDSFKLRFWYCLQCLPKPYLWSLLSFKFSKAADLYKIKIWYCFPTYSSLSFLRLHLSTSNFCAPSLLNANLSLTFATTRQWSVSVSSPENHTRIILECHLLSINTWSIWLWVFPSREVQTYLRMLCCWNIKLLTPNCLKFTILTPLSLLSWYRLSFPTVGLKISSLRSYALKSPNRLKSIM